MSDKYDCTSCGQDLRLPPLTPYSLTRLRHAERELMRLAKAVAAYNEKRGELGAAVKIAMKTLRAAPETGDDR